MLEIETGLVAPYPLYNCSGPRKEYFFSDSVQLQRNRGSCHGIKQQKFSAGTSGHQGNIPVSPGLHQRGCLQTGTPGAGRKTFFFYCWTVYLKKFLVPVNISIL